jgi:hypothetical protein
LGKQAVRRTRDRLERARCPYAHGWSYARQGYRDAAATALQEAAALATIEGEVVYGEILALMAELQIEAE